MAQLPPADIRLYAMQHNDREIATAYSVNQKAAAMDYAKSVLECSNPDLRTFLENAFLNSNRHAYDIWQYMITKGYYPLAQAPAADIQKVGDVYPIVNQ